MRDKHKRITIPVSGTIESIKEQLEKDHGVSYSYGQVIDFLIHNYRKQNKIGTVWQIDKLGERK